MNGRWHFYVRISSDFFHDKKVTESELECNGCVEAQCINMFNKQVIYAIIGVKLISICNYKILTLVTINVYLLHFRFVFYRLCHSPNETQVTLQLLPKDFQIPAIVKDATWLYYTINVKTKSNFHVFLCQKLTTEQVFIVNGDRRL